MQATCGRAGHASLMGHPPAPTGTHRWLDQAFTARPGGCGQAHAGVATVQRDRVGGQGQNAIPARPPYPTSWVFTAVCRHLAPHGWEAAALLCTAGVGQLNSNEAASQLMVRRTYHPLTAYVTWVRWALGAHSEGWCCSLRLCRAALRAPGGAVQVFWCFGWGSRAYGSPPGAIYDAIIPFPRQSGDRTIYHIQCPVATTWQRVADRVQCT